MQFLRSCARRLCGLAVICGLYGGWCLGVISYSPPGCYILHMRGVWRWGLFWGCLLDGGKGKVYCVAVWCSCNTKQYYRELYLWLSHSLWRKLCQYGSMGHSLMGVRGGGGGRGWFHEILESSLQQYNPDPRPMPSLKPPILDSPSRLFTLFPPSFPPPPPLIQICSFQYHTHSILSFPPFLLSNFLFSPFLPLSLSPSLGGPSR